MTHERVAAVQRHFVVLVAAEGELDTQFLEDLRHRDPARAVPGIDAFVSQWQPMTADFASLIGVMADNVDNFDRVVALDRITARWDCGHSTTSAGFPRARCTGDRGRPRLERLASMAQQK